MATLAAKHTTLSWFVGPDLMKRALIDSFKRLTPRYQWRNPVMFVVYIGSLLTTILWLQALTGTEFDLVTRQVNNLSKEAWAETRRRYDRLAETHARTCQYREFNDWLRQHPANAGK